MEKYLAIDIGGTSIKYALIDKNLNISMNDIMDTPQNSLDELVNIICTLYERYQTKITGIAISMPGVIDSKNGYCLTGGALQYLNNVPFVELLKKKCSVSITIANDAKCAGYAEVSFGSLKDVDNSIVLVLGTAIGGCLIKDKEVYIGKHFGAGEFSFINTDSHHYGEFDYTWWGKNGSNALLKIYQKLINSDHQFTGREIFEKANNGDKYALKSLHLYTLELAIQIFNIQSIFDAEKIAIGGGISAQPLLLELINKNVDEVFSKNQSPIYRPDIVPCKFRNDANLIGALYLHLQN